MGVMQLYQYRDTDLTGLANDIKEVLIGSLHREGVIQSNPQDLCGLYVVVVTKPGLFGKAWNRVRGIKDEESLIISVARSTDWDPDVDPEPTKES